MIDDMYIDHSHCFSDGRWPLGTSTLNSGFARKFASSMHLFTSSLPHFSLAAGPRFRKGEMFGRGLSSSVLLSFQAKVRSGLAAALRRPIR